MQSPKPKMKFNTKKYLNLDPEVPVLPVTEKDGEEKVKTVENL
jgi:hypothetical protein